MGCDIHLHTEIKVDGVWHHVATANFERNYALFNFLAGVRGDGPGIAPCRGVPEDASLVTRMDCDHWGADGHSHSFLHSYEIPVVEDWLKDTADDLWPERQWGYFFGNSWGGFVKYPHKRPTGVEDVRFVFWFDN